MCGERTNLVRPLWNFSIVVDLLNWYPGRTVNRGLVGIGYQECSKGRKGRRMEKKGEFSSSYGKSPVVQRYRHCTQNASSFGSSPNGGSSRHNVSKLF
jgi:hypothetical protein